MRKFSAILLAVCLTAGSTTLFAKPKTNYKAFSPSDNGKSVMLKSDSKQYRYFVLEKGESIGFEVKGPTRVKIRTRALLPEKASSGDYSVIVWEGEKSRGGRKVSVTASKVNIDGTGKVGVARDIFIKVPRGKHKFSVTVQSENVDKVFLRFYQEKKKKKKQTYVPFHPYEYANKVKLKSGKSSISYYIIDENGGTRLKVIGPTKIKIYCRANFDPTMKEKSKFTLGVFENGETVKKFSAVTKKSTRSLFTDLPELIPSKLHTYILEVPKGEHVYEFKKINSMPNSLAARFKIQKSSLGKKK